MTDPLFLIVDLFCGFGGTTKGFVDARINGSDIAKVIACVNHDHKAIQSHWLNNTDVKHFEEDIRTLDLTELIKIVAYWRSVYPNAYLILWASLECQHFSKAKGGKARKGDSRTLAQHLFRYQKALKPDYIQIENVVEFMSWGPLDSKGKPLSRKNGQDWVKWRNKMNTFGYYDQWKELNSADYGAYTSRNRLFGCFAKHGLPIVWPVPTHSKKENFSMHGNLKKWMPVKDVLDFSDEGLSIFGRKKPLSNKTLERIYAGLVKYVANGDKAFISKYYSGKPKGKVISVDGPAGTITTGDGQSLIQPEFLLKYNSMSSKGIHTPPSVNQPCPVIAAQPRIGLVQPQFLTHYYSNGGELSSIESPAPVIPTKARTALIQPIYFIDKHFSKSQNQSIDNPAGTLMPTDKHRLVEATPFIMPTNFNNLPKSIEEPAPTLTASRRHHYIVNPSHGGHTTSIDAPCPVIIARQDKAPLSMVECEGGNIRIPVYEGDPEILIRIKEFMVIYNLIDIKMRMLRVKELLRIQGFSDKYKMVGNQSDQKKYIGNSVHPLVPKFWAEALGARLTENKKAA